MKRQSGQALVLVLLSLAVILTLVLYILSRTITDVAVSSRQEEAVRAFSAAEAGVERALIAGASLPSTLIGDASYTVDVATLATSQNSFVYPITLSSGDSALVWFVDHDANSEPTCGAGSNCFTGRFVNVCWGRQSTSPTTSTTPAVEVSVFYETTPGNPATARIARVSIDPYTTRAVTGVGGASPNKFSSPDAGTCGVSGQTLAFHKQIDLATLGIPAGAYGAAGGLRFARLRMLYNSDESHPIAFDVSASGTTFPSQGLLVNAMGTAGESNRRLNVFQSWPEPPSVFDYAIYSSTGLSK